MPGPSADGSQVFFEMAHKSLVHHALSKPGAGAPMSAGAPPAGP